MTSAPACAASIAAVRKGEFDMGSQVSRWKVAAGDRWRGKRKRGEVLECSSEIQAGPSGPSQGEKAKRATSGSSPVTHHSSPLLTRVASFPTFALPIGDCVRKDAGTGSRYVARNEQQVRRCPRNGIRVNRHRGNLMDFQPLRS